MQKTEENAKHGWLKEEKRHTVYECTDGLLLSVPHRMCQFYTRSWPDIRVRKRKKLIKIDTPRNGITYRRAVQETTRTPRLLVSETELSRDMSAVVCGYAKVRTILFPNTVRVIWDGAFCKNNALKSAVLNEGLETLGKYQKNSSYKITGAFSNTELQQITLPSTLEDLGKDTFNNCQNL